MFPAVRSGGQLEFDGGVDEQVPLHCHVPLLWICPQAFGAEVQAAPYVLPPGMVTAGGVEEQAPLHWMVPFACVWPQAF